MELILSVVPVQFAYYFFNFTIILDFLFTNLRYKLIKPHLSFHLRNLFSICRIIYNCYHSRLLKRVISSNVIACSSKVFRFVTPFPNIPLIRQVPDSKYNSPFRLPLVGILAQNSPRNHFSSGRMFLDSSPYLPYKGFSFLLQKCLELFVQDD